MPARRFPPPWTVEEVDACFVMRDHKEQTLAYVYFEDEPGRRSAAKLLTRNEARRIAANIAKSPDCAEGLTGGHPDQRVNSPPSKMADRNRAQVFSLASRERAVAGRRSYTPRNKTACSNSDARQIAISLGSGRIAVELRRPH
jgi:hypothetical protein